METNHFSMENGKKSCEKSSPS